MHDNGVNALRANFQNDEVWAKVTGRCLYGIDLRVPGMLWGKILRSPHAHALIKSIDVSRAKKVPGVKAIITAREISARPYGVAIDDELPLAADKVRYMGDEVAAVAAINEEAAREALELIRVEYEPLPAVFDPGEAMSPEAPLVHDNFPGNIAWRRLLERGDVEKAFCQADLVIEDNFSTQTVHQMYLEPMSCVASWEAYHGLILHTALQSPHVVRNLLARVLELPRSKVRIIGPYMGGGFGGKVYGNIKLYLLAAILSRLTGAPVKMQLTREEEFTAGRPMGAVTFHIKMGLKKDGTLLAREAEIVLDNGAYAAQMPFVAKTLSERNDSLYRIPHLRTRAYLVYTNKVPTGQYRGFGNPNANFAFESMLDMAARELGIDPLEIRLKNCSRQGDTTVHGLRIKSCALPACLQEAAAKIGRPDKAKARGVGLAAAIHLNGNTAGFKGFSGSSALARLEEDGRVTVLTGDQDYGQGTHSTFALIASRVLGIAPEQIHVHSKDTASTPFSMGAFACRQTTIGGNAVRLAAENLKKLVEETATLLLGEEARWEGDHVRGKGGGTLTLEEVALRGMYLHNGQPLTAEGSYTPPDTTDADERGYGNISPTYSFAAHAAEVEVDRETGALTVRRIVAVHDSGKILNYLAGRGQVFGGVTQALGYGCLEGYIFREGKVLNPDLASYQIPTSLDVPPVEPVFMEAEDPVGPFGAKGLGEIVLVPAMAAIANAVADAAGVRIRDLPITPEKIWRALQEKRNEK